MSAFRIGKLERAILNEIAHGIEVHGKAHARRLGLEDFERLRALHVVRAIGSQDFQALGLGA